MMGSHIDQQEHPNRKRIAWRQWIKWGAVIFLTIDVAVTIMVWPSIRLLMFNFQEQAKDDPSSTTVLMTDLKEQPTETLPAVETTSISESETIRESTAESATETESEKPTTQSTSVAVIETTGLLDFISASIYQNTTIEDALALFNTLDSLDDLISHQALRECCQFYGKCEGFAYYGLSEKLGENTYLFYECFETGQFELRLCNASNMLDYQVLASKPLPADCTAENVYDYWMKTWCPINCIDDAKLALILKTANLAPFVVQETTGIISRGITISDDRTVFCGNFYRTTDRKTIMVYEDHNLKQMYYKVVPITEYQIFMEGPFEGHVKLSPDANINNFRVFG